MTEQMHYTVPAAWLELIQAQGWEALPALLTLLINAAMRAERDAYLGAGRYERAPDRRGHANGFKPKTVQTRLGDLTFAVP
jgi:transposase-like protein